MSELLKLTQENKIIDLPDLNRFQIGDHVIVDANADYDRFEGIIIGIELRRMHGSNHLVQSITILHDGCITDEFKPIDCRKVEAPAPVKNVVGWQDISTAPKTGEEFIARTGPEWSSFSCSWDGEMFVHCDRDDGIIAYGPKQWMPMPGPDAAPESPSDLSVGERLQDLEHLLESVRACYFVGRPDCPNEFVQSTWEKVKAADDARAALAPAEREE